MATTRFPLLILTLMVSAFGLTVPGQADNHLSTLVVAVNSDPGNIEPGTNRAHPIGSEMILNIFDTLVAWTPPAFEEMEGRLAESWTVSPDGKEFTFKLRDGITFHDGADLNAEAVKFSLERTKKINPYMKANFGLISEITVLGPLEVKIALNKAMPVFLSILAQPQAAVVSPAAVEKFVDSFNVNPVGTGPFKFVSYTPDTNVILEANSDYFRGAPQLSRIIFRVIPEASTRRLELENGGIDISQQNGQLYSIPVEDIKAFNDNPDVDVIQVPSQIFRQFEFNNSHPDSPVNDIRVRQAMAYAVDYDGLLDGVLGGTASRVYGPLPTNSWAFNPAMKERAFSYDPEKSRALLAKAGYQPGELKFKLYSFQGSLWGSLCTFLQANFADVGIDVEVAQTEFPIYRNIHTTGQHEIAMDGRQPWYNDPDAHITIGYHSDLASSAMTFRMPPDEDLDNLILQAQSAVDFEERKALYFTIQEMLMDRVPAAYLFSNKIIVFKRSNVEGLVINSAPPLNEYWSVYKS